MMTYSENGCLSSTAAAKSIERTQEVSGVMVLEELGKVRDVWVGSKWNYYSRRKDDIMKKLHGFQKIEGDNSNVLYDLVKRIEYITEDSFKKIFMTDREGLCRLCEVGMDVLCQSITLIVFFGTYTPSLLKSHVSFSSVVLGLSVDCTLEMLLNLLKTSLPACLPKLITVLGLEYDN